MKLWGGSDRGRIRKDGSYPVSAQGRGCHPVSADTYDPRKRDEIAPLERSCGPGFHYVDVRAAKEGTVEVEISLYELAKTFSFGKVGLKPLSGTYHRRTFQTLRDNTFYPF